MVAHASELSAGLDRVDENRKQLEKNMATKKTKPKAPPTPPPPYVTAPDWLVDARDSINYLKKKTQALRAKADLFQLGKLKVDEFSEIERELLEDIDFHATDAYLALDKAIKEADRTETIKIDILEALRDAYNRVRRISA